MLAPPDNRSSPVGAGRPARANACANPSLKAASELVSRSPIAASLALPDPASNRFGQKKRGARFPPRPPIFAVRRRLHLLGGIRSSGSSVASSVGCSSSSVSCRGGSIGCNSSSVGCSSSFSSGFGSSFGSSFGGFRSLFRAGRESESGAGSGSSENDLAHVWYSLNSEWTTRDTTSKWHCGSSGKPTSSVDFSRQLIAFVSGCKRLSRVKWFQA